MGVSQDIGLAPENLGERLEVYVTLLCGESHKEVGCAWLQQIRHMESLAKPENRCGGDPGSLLSI